LRNGDPLRAAGRDEEGLRTERVEWAVDIVELMALAVAQHRGRYAIAAIALLAAKDFDRRRDRLAASQPLYDIRIA
jgi:hypothetical protein